MTKKRTTGVTLAKTLAPEDVRRGMYVAVLDQEYQYPAIVWTCDDQMSDREEVIRVRLRPQDTEAPLRVCDACLPFVFVEPPRGKPSTLDLRSVRLVRIDRGYAKRVWKRLQKKKQS